MTVILSSVKIGELQILLSDIYNMFKENNKAWVFNPENPKHDFWDCIIRSESEILRDAMMNFVKKDKDLFIEFISYHPEQVSIYLSDKALARKIWTEWITDMFRFSPWVDEDVFLEEGGEYSVWICVKKLLEENIIPQREVEEFFSGFVPYNMVEFMYNYDYFKSMRNIMFEEKTYSKTYLPNDANKYWYAMKGIIMKLGIEENDILVLEKLYRKLPKGIFHYGLGDLLANNEEFKAQYMEVLEKHNIEIPNKIK
ncbi:hypothetical protein [Clostridioides sp. ZZV14-6345]|uniref:hypothetical protein n=1 Tax=Clostridioides sp. ZZV14-6345 TaxID=2811496 RepID=UPI001D102C4C|nr:hypothetical protein [Clostridioides sp. ZZV14-6345]